MIQSQEAHLAQTRQQLNENSNQLAEMKTRLEESQKQLSLTQRWLGVATREAERLNASRSPAPRRTQSRAPDTAASLAAPSGCVRSRSTACREQELNPSEIARAVGRSVQRVSTILGALRLADVVRYDTDGKRNRYRHPSEFRSVLTALCRFVSSSSSKGDSAAWNPRYPTMSIVVPAKSNAQLVERIVGIATQLGREIATPDDSRFAATTAPNRLRPTRTWG